MKQLLVGVALVLPCTVCGSARADFAQNEYTDYKAPPAERRGGFTAGLSYAPGLVTATGYPNKLDEIGVSEFERSVSGFGVGSSLWLGGMLRDWIGFAVGFSSRASGDQSLTSGGLAFRIEGFPLYSLGTELRDVGIFGEFGAGGSVITEDDDVVADGGFTSLVGFGVFWEPWQFWHFSAGPVAQYNHEFSQSMSAHAATIGLRLAFYGVQPR